MIFTVLKQCHKRQYFILSVVFPAILISVVMLMEIFANLPAVGIAHIFFQGLSGIIYAHLARELHV